MTWPVSSQWEATSRLGGKLFNEITCTPPGGSPQPLVASAASITKALGTGPRITGSLMVAPEPGKGTFDLVTTPGSRFHLRHGFEYGPADRELIPLGELVLSRNRWASKDQISLDLSDKWQWLDERRLLTPATPAAAPRAATISDFVVSAIPGQTVIVNATGGSHVGGTTWETSRTEAITQLTVDGRFDAGFAADGTFVIEADPILNPRMIAWTFTDGETGTITEYDREIPFERQYNTIVVKPIDETQTWTPVKVSIAQPSHPRHPSRIGYVPYYYSSPTLSTAAMAWQAAKTILPRVINPSKPLSLGSVNCAHLEPGDTISVLRQATELETAQSGYWLIESVAHDLMTGASSITARSTAQPDMEEI